MLASYQFSPAQPSSSLVYLPLGDSYTICQGLSRSERWPNQLTKDLNASGYTVTLAGNPARTGYTSKDLINRELDIFDKVLPDFVTLMIGVNDYLRGKDTAYFHHNLKMIIDHLQARLKNPKGIVLIAIPDYSVTETGKLYCGGRDVSNDLKIWNSLIELEAGRRGLLFVDIYKMTQQMGDDQTLVSEDGLHPSAKGVAMWEKEILKKVLEMMEGIE